MKNFKLPQINNSGFTMFELVVVCFMVGFFAAFVRVSIHNGAYLEAATKKVTGDLLGCRDAAMTSGKAVGLYKSSSTDYYVMYQLTPTNIQIDGSTGQPKQEDLKRWKGVSVPSTFQIEFDAYGRTTINSGPIDVSDASQSRSISVNEETGYVQVM